MAMLQLPFEAIVLLSFSISTILSADRRLVLFPLLLQFAIFVKYLLFLLLR